MSDKDSVKDSVSSVSSRPWNKPVLFWGSALVFGYLELWSNRFYMGNDGVSYLDIADAYLRGDWHTAFNSAWLIGLDFLILRPPAHWEYTAVQLLNFFIYALTVIGFEFFLRQLVAWRQFRDDLGIRLVAYALFLWSSLILIGTWTTNADMLVAAFEAVDEEAASEAGLGRGLTGALRLRTCERAMRENRERRTRRTQNRRFW